MIKQHTKEWLKAKQNSIGASSVFSLIEYYCREELVKAGIDLKGEKPFKSTLELFLSIKLSLTKDTIKEGDVNNEFGLGMESYLVYRLQKEMPNLDFKKSDEFIQSPNIHPLAVCSPDGYLSVNKGHEVSDFDNNNQIDSSWQKGALELKTTPYSFNFKSLEGVKWQYLFQLQYQMLVCNKKWGMLAALSPKEREFDCDFFKGKILGYIKAIKEYGFLDDISNFGKFKLMHSQYNLHTYIYLAIPTLQNICLLALKRFQEALDKYDKALIKGEVPLMPACSFEDKEKALREKTLLAQICPAKFGSIEALSMTEGEVINAMMDERQFAHIEGVKCESEKARLDAEITKVMNSHIELIGANYKAKFAKDGSLRFSKNKTHFNKKY